MTDIKLRPYQRDFIDAVRNQFLHNHKKVVGVAPCGAGKTIMTGWMIKESLNRGKRSIFFVHRRELIEQTSKTFTALDIPHGIIAADLPSDLNLPVQIASVQTLARRLNSIPAPDFLICDECHHILANTYKQVLDAFPNAYLLGVTATPQRMGGITLCDVFTSMVQSLSVSQLIDKGNLTPFEYLAPDIGVDLDNVRSKSGEFVNSDLEHEMSDKKIIGGIVENYVKYAHGKAAICYCVNVRHSKTVAKAFQNAGISAAHCDGETPKRERAAIVDAFRRGDINVLCNAELFGEGFDVPHCQAVILARPTQSLTLHVQQSMRSMRPDPNDPNKVAIIIDHVQNWTRHGLPDDDRDWSLNPNERDEKKKKPRICPKCNLVVSYKAHSCPRCGYIFPVGKKHVADTTEYSGDLTKIIPIKKEKQETQQPLVNLAFTKPEEFLSEAKIKGYEIGWVAAKSLKYARSYEDCLHIAFVCGYKKGWAYYKWREINEELCKKKSLQKVPLVC